MIEQFYILQAVVDSEYLFTTEESGVFTINSINVSSAATLDWGDGSTTALSSGINSTVTHDYASAVGEKLVTLTEPEKLLAISVNTQDVRKVSVMEYANCAGLSFISCADLSAVNLASNTFTASVFLSGSAITSINLAGCTVTNSNFSVSNCASLASITWPTTSWTPQDFIIDRTLIDSIDLSNIAISDNLNYRDLGLTKVEHDAVIDHIYTHRASFTTPVIDSTGSSSPNTVPTGTYDGSTDWSGGVPTSPMAKVYDLENNVTGTYNFDFTDFP